jgi:predicted nucleotidyltransferase
MSLFEELIEVKSIDKKIVKSFKTKDSLSGVIFDKSGSDFFMRDEIKKRLLEISDDFIEFLGIEFFIHDIVLTGSLANYNWSEFSDVDLHILIDFKETDYKLDILKEFFDSKKNLWNKNHDIKIKNYDVELYVQDVEEKHLSSGVYSVLHDKWLVTPEKTNPKIDDRKIIEKGEEYANQIDDLISKSKNGEDVSEEIDSLKDKIKRFRQSGLDDGGEYSYENLTFKLLRRNGYIEKLINLKSEVTDKKLSITQ